jgi:hypothetical protein
MGVNCVNFRLLILMEVVVGVESSNKGFGVLNYHFRGVCLSVLICVALVQIG